jgi:hypothetical protein
MLLTDIVHRRNGFLPAKRLPTTGKISQAKLPIQTEYMKL